MTQEQFEKDLKNKFQNYMPTSDESALWSSIIEELDEKPKKRRFLFWFLLPLVAFSIFTVTFYNKTDSLPPLKTSFLKTEVIEKVADNERSRTQNVKSRKEIIEVSEGASDETLNLIKEEQIKRGFNKGLQDKKSNNSPKRKSILLTDAATKINGPLSKSQVDSRTLNTETKLPNIDGEVIDSRESQLLSHFAVVPSLLFSIERPLEIPEIIMIKDGD